MYVKLLICLLLSFSMLMVACGKSGGNAPEVLASTDGPSSGSIYGRVTDSLTGQPIENVSVAVYSGASVVSSTSTNANGQYVFGEFANSNYTMNFQASGYVSILNSAIAVNGTSLNVNKSMSPPTISGQLRIVLTWYAENPAVPNISPDLDAYFLNKTENTFVYYQGTSVTWSDGASGVLDQDSTTYSGPETITVSNISASSSYSFYVHNYMNYDDCSSLAASGVHVDVYQGAGIIKSYDIPASTMGGGGATYEFFRIQNGVIGGAQTYNETLPIGEPTRSNCVP